MFGFKSESQDNTKIDCKLSIEEILKKWEYPLEKYDIITPDGYVLKLFRINGRKGQNPDKILKDKDFSTLNEKEPVLFQHGLLDSSDGFLCNDEHLSLPLILCNLGYDIWLSNSRGNKYSRRHVKYNPDKDYEFWQFSFHEMGHIDLPCIIEFILSVNTHHNKLHYIGHSQGTCMLFAALGNKNYKYKDGYLVDFYRERLKSFIALAPVARVGNMKSGLLKLVNFFSPKIVKDMMSEEFMPEVKEGLHKDFGIWINNAFPSMANTMIDLIADKNSMKVNNQNRVPVYLSHYPSGSSLKSIKHFTQNSESKKFEMYNYGKEANCFLYQSINPSEYDLSSLNGFNIALISGGEDKLSNKADVLWLKEILDKGGNLSYFKEYKEMGHISFMVGLNVDWFNDVVDFVYSNSDIELSKLKQKEIYETKLN